MGYAIIDMSADYSASGLGKVTFTKSMELVSLSISEGAKDKNNIQLVINYNPTATNQRGVTWSISNGSEYASINQDGVLSVKNGADNSQVTVVATSSVKPSISSTITLNVTYEDVVEEGWFYDHADDVAVKSNAMSGNIYCSDTNWEEWVGKTINSIKVPGNNASYTFSLFDDNVKIGGPWPQSGGITKLDAPHKITGKLSVLCIQQGALKFDSGASAKDNSRLYYSANGTTWQEWTSESKLLVSLGYFN